MQTFIKPYNSTMKKKITIVQNPTLSFSFRNPEEFLMLKRYCSYRRLVDERHPTRSEVIVEILMEVINSDQIYDRFCEINKITK